MTAPGATRLAGLEVAVSDLGAATAAYAGIGLRRSGPLPRPGPNGERLVFDDGTHVDLVAEAGTATGSHAARPDAPGAGTDRVLSVVLSADDPGALLAPCEERGYCVVEQRDGRTVLRLPDPLRGAVVLSSGPEFPGTGGRQGLWNHCLVAPDVDPVLAALSPFGAVISRAARPGWGLDTGVIQLACGHLEVVAPLDVATPEADATRAWLETRGAGHYMEVVSVPDADAWAGELSARGVAMLGPVVDTPDGSPWPPARQFWVHPGETPGSFVEFISFGQDEHPQDRS